MIISVVNMGLLNVELLGLLCHIILKHLYVRFHCHIQATQKELQLKRKTYEKIHWFQILVEIKSG